MEELLNNFGFKKLLLFFPIFFEEIIADKIIRCIKRNYPGAKAIKKDYDSIYSFCINPFLDANLDYDDKFPEMADDGFCDEDADRILCSLLDDLDPDNTSDMNMSLEKAEFDFDSNILCIVFYAENIE